MNPSSTALSASAQSFILHCGEMGSRWGFNRTVGQICALLVISEEPISADDIASALAISRGNVSMGVKELQSWRLIQLSRKPGDRKDYYAASASIWQMAQTVFEERRRRELDPTLSLLRDQLLNQDTEASPYTLGRLQEIHDLLELLGGWGNSLNTLQPETLQQLMRLGAGVGKVIEFKDKLGRKNSDD